MFNWQYLITLIPIAVIISIIVFLVKFFGKVISDQVPFADSRSWHEELNGVLFFSNQILSPVILILIVYSRGWRFWLFPKEDWLLLVVGILTFISLSIASKKSISFLKDNDFDDGNYLSCLKNSFGSNDDKKIGNGDQMVYYKYLVFPLISLCIMIITLFFYFWGQYYHSISALLYLFFHLTAFALLLSLIKRNIMLADIKFTDKSHKMIKNGRVLKINDDNIKIYKDKKVIILNKALIASIEVFDKKKKKIIVKL